MNTKLLIGGLVAGAVAGAAAAFLFSPEGEKTREKLMKGVKKLTDSLGDSPVGEVVKESINKVVGEVGVEGRQRISSLAEKAKI